MLTTNAIHDRNVYLVVGHTAYAKIVGSWVIGVAATRKNAIQLAECYGATRQYKEVSIEYVGMNTHALGYLRNGEWRKEYASLAKAGVKSVTADMHYDIEKIPAYLRPR